MRAPIPMPRTARPGGYPIAANPFDWTALQGGLRRNSNALIGAGSQLMAGDLAGAGQGWAQGNAIDYQRNVEQQQLAEAEAQKNQTLQYLQQNRPDLAAMVQAGMPVSEAWNQLLKPADTANLPASVQEYQFAKQNGYKGSFEEWRTGGNQTVRAGLGQPIPLRNKQTGETVPFMPMSDGTYQNPLTGQKADASWEFDPAYIAAQRAAGTAYGTAQGGAQFNLPKAAQDVEFELQNIANLKNDTAGMEEAFGKIAGVYPQQWAPVIPGTKRADFNARLEQIVGQNFLQAYSTLRGAGAITEAEGAKAQSAMGRLSQAQSKEAFQQALTDLEEVLKAGYARMQQQAMTPYAGSNPGPAPSAGATDLKTKYGLE